MKILPYSCLVLAFIGSNAWANPAPNLPNNQEHYDAQSIADILTQLNGDPTHPKYKVNHTKGWCASGVFTPTHHTGINLPIFTQDHIPVQIRYSLGGANWSDKSKPRGMAIKFNGDKGKWTQVMLSAPINFAHTVDEFGLFFKIRLPKDGKVDKAMVDKVMKEVPSFRHFSDFIKTVGITKAFTQTAFHSVHTFWFKTDDGKVIPARWYWQPAKGVHYYTKEELAQLPDNFLLKNSLADLKSGDASYTLYLVLANPGDITDDTSALWHGFHREIDMGKLVLKSFDDLSCDSQVYFPSQLPKGVQPPKDPLFNTRNAAYSIKYGQRVALPEEKPRDLQKEAEGKPSRP